MCIVGQERAQGRAREASGRARATLDGLKYNRVGGNAQRTTHWFEVRLLLPKKFPHFATLSLSIDLLR